MCTPAGPGISHYHLNMSVVPSSLIWGLATKPYHYIWRNTWGWSCLQFFRSVFKRVIKMSLTSLVAIFNFILIYATQIYSLNTVIKGFLNKGFKQINRPPCRRTPSPNSLKSLIAFISFRKAMDWIELSQGTILGGSSKAEVVASLCWGSPWGWRSRWIAYTLRVSGAQSTLFPFLWGMFTSTLAWIVWSFPK